MGQSEQRNTCAIVCWVIAILIGIIVFFLLRPGVALLLALILAVAVMFGLSWLFKKLVCGTEESAAGATTATAPASAAPVAEPAAAEPTPEAPSASEAQPDAPAEETPAVEETAEQAEETLEEAVPEVAAPAAVAPETKAEEAPAAAETSGPEVLAAARDGAPDDLKQIKGVGPALEKTLNELGFYHFDQIAAWTDADVEWVDSRLKFKGRITRDDWIGQAKEFAGS